jgi:hypothetical protein
MFWKTSERPTIQKQSQAALAEFKTGLVQTLPTVVQSVDMLQHAERELFQREQHGIAKN